MHILGLLAAVIGGIAIWYFRSRRAATMIDGAVDVAQTVRGGIKRRRHADLSDASAITAIDDPLMATATLAHIVAGQDGWPRTHAAVKEGLIMLAGQARADEAVTFAEWAARQGVDEDRAVDVLCETLSRLLPQEERTKVVNIVRQSAGVTPDGETARLLHRAEQRLGAA